MSKSCQNMCKEQSTDLNQCPDCLPKSSWMMTLTALVERHPMVEMIYGNIEESIMMCEIGGWDRGEETVLSGVQDSEGQG